MSTDKQPSIISSDVNTLPPRKTRVDPRLEFAPYRATYTPKNAELFRGIYDKMHDTQQAQEILCSVTGLRPNTIYLKAQDALKWLAENHPTNRDRYMILRSRISIRKMEDRILLYFKSNIGNAISAATAGVSMTREWKVELQRWLTNAQDGEIFTKEGIHLEPDDVAWLTKLVAGLGAGAELEMVGTTGFRVMR